MVAFVTAVGSRAYIVKVDSDSVHNAYSGLGKFLYDNGAKEASLDAFSSSVDAQDNPSARYNLGVVNNELGNHETSEENLRKAIELDPGNAKWRNGLAVFLFEHGRLAEAAEQFRIVIQLEPKNAQAHFDLGVSLADNVRNGLGTVGDLLEAREHFMVAERLSPGYPHAASNAEVLSQILG